MQSFDALNKLIARTKEQAAKVRKKEHRLRKVQPITITLHGLDELDGVIGALEHELDFINALEAKGDLSEEDQKVAEQGRSILSKMLERFQKTRARHV